MQVQVARIGKPHGIRGEVTVQVFTDVPEERFAPGEVFNTEKGEVLTVASARWNKDILLLGFEEVPDRNRAEELRGTRLTFDLDETGSEEVEGDAWYEHELIGLEVRIGSEKVGEVSALNIMPAQDLLEITALDGSEVLIPFVEQIVPEVNVEAGFIRITPPDGLFELNSENAEGTEG
ncbi:16S rRNA processing protein RimM [Psychromicrobium silvestre]|uniref:Ribosome maturation factor RimM n=1 Tax=Psychromicrobium silvestre TaxID=1645614 RepID=A0A7Y9S5P7_9MICC|nr:ribosome maturation factor RimM [Psychromicrobium silvestre]NYE94610.1 16S rRNA processing protein RimM [Psychromicrobium silvestre]